MTLNLTEEAEYRMNERLGILLQGRAPTPRQWEEVAMDALRWQRQHDNISQTRPVKGPESPILEAE